MRSTCSLEGWFSKTRLVAACSIRSIVVDITTVLPSLLRLRSWGVLLVGNGTSVWIVSLVIRAMIGLQVALGRSAIC